MALRHKIALLLAASGLVPLVACTSAGGSTTASTLRASPFHTTSFSQSRSVATLGDALPETDGAHLAISLQRQNEDALEALLRDQQDPASPRFHAWLTPEQYGQRFGLPEATYARVLDWLRAEGFAVTPYPNRLFVEATGTVAQVRSLVGVQLRAATLGSKTFRSFDEDELALPDDIAPLVLKIGGLDTRVRLRHRTKVEWYGDKTFELGPDDLRTMYDIPSTDLGAQGLTLAILATEEGTEANPNDAGEDAGLSGPAFLPDRTAIEDYLTVAHATVAYNPISLPNNDDDYDTGGSNSEYQLDVEMQSVGAPNAKEIDLVLSPASVVFQTGAQYIVNHLSEAVAVSTSLGLCESEEVEYDGGAATNSMSDAFIMRQTVQQGLAEGQTWFAASGDSGADDCYDEDSDTHNGFGGGNATVDFPCSAPEVLCVGGTMFGQKAAWSSTGDLTAYVPEVVCNEGSDGVGGGGGQSMLYKKPAYQAGVGPEATDGQRDLPDISLIAASNTPGVVDYDCGEGQDACGDAGTGVPLLDLTGGTSVSSPLAAGMFAHLAGDVGCRLGDIHATLYALGAAQQANPGPTQPFHDIVKGNNSYPDPTNKVIDGFTAGAGYDLASGWGSVDLAKLVKAWPSCGQTDAGALMRQDAAATEPDGGVAPTMDGGKVAPKDGGRPDATRALKGVDASLDLGGVGPDGKGTSGGGCNAAGSAPGSDWMGALLALGMVVVRRRRRGVP